MVDDVLVKVCVEQGLQSEDGITHGTLIYHPERQKKHSEFAARYKRLNLYTKKRNVKTEVFR